MLAAGNTAEIASAWVRAGAPTDVAALTAELDALFRASVQTMVPVKMPLPVITLDAGLESLLAQAVRAGPNASHPFEPALAQRIVGSVTEAAQPLVGQAKRFAIVTSPVARRHLARLLRPHLPDVPVMSFLELPDGKPVEVAAVVGGQPQQMAPMREPVMVV